MLDPFDFILDIILLRWLIGDDEGSRLIKFLVFILVVAAIVVVLGFLLKWW